MYEAVVTRPGKDLTLLTYGPMVKTCLQAAEAAAEEGNELEVVDLRSVSPIDMPVVLESVRRTGRAVVVHEAPHTAGLGAEIAALASQSCFDALKAPVERVTGFDVPYPAGDLEEEYLPNIDRILFGIQRTLEYRRG